MENKTVYVCFVQNSLGVLQGEEVISCFIATQDQAKIDLWLDEQIAEAAENGYTPDEDVNTFKGFVEPDEEMTQQVTKEEFEEVLSECEDKCAIMTCIEEAHTINVAEVPLYNKFREFGLRFKNNAINLFLPKIDINADTKKFIGEELGIVLYKVLTKKFTPEYLRHEMNRYIGESRRREESTKELFKEYFYQVVLYKERKPGIYLEFDDHMRRIFVLEFFKRIIREYLEKQEGKSSAKNSRVFT